ncbi:MAG TPA: UTP--glucose-1-phosphate uridylyltransferase [Anaeromyxobacteraceae bacterium]|nr:UTP--glucose-1-phosphate uridylyltransferase [Anaeromyxobacteraceae bacterium]
MERTEGARPEAPIHGEAFVRLVARARAAAEAAKTRLEIGPLEPGDLEPWPGHGSARRRELEALGERAFARGEVASVVVAGGAATRFGGAVKALVPAIGGRTFLDLKLADARRAAARFGRDVPVAVMTSDLTHDAIAAHLAGAPDVIAFRQRMLPRLTAEFELWRDASGAPQLAPAGHGDFFRALRESGAGEELARRGVRQVYFTNVDNLAATLEPVIAGAHLALDGAMTVEVTDRRGPSGQLAAGAAPVRVGGRPVLVEQVDPARHPLISTNNITFDLARILERELPLPLRAVSKEVDGARVLQVEQVTGEVTLLTDAAGQPLLPCRFLVVPRAEPDATRFEPVKAREDLGRVAARLAPRFEDA